MSDAVYTSLRGNVSFLGRLLGETIAAAQGQEFLDLVEQIRRLSKSASEGSRQAREELQAVLHKMISRTMRLLTRRGCWSDCTTHLVMSRRSLCSGWQRMQLVWSLLPSRPCSRG